VETSIAHLSPGASWRLKFNRLLALEFADKEENSNLYELLEKTFILLIDDLFPP